MDYVIPPPVSKDEVLRFYAAYTHITDVLWLVRDKRHWAMYEPGEGTFLSPFMYREFDHPTGKAPDICGLYTDDRLLRYHTIERYFLIK